MEVVRIISSVNRAMNIWSDDPWYNFWTITYQSNNRIITVQIKINPGLITHYSKLKIGKFYNMNQADSVPGYKPAQYWYFDDDVTPMDMFNWRRHEN